MAYHGAGRQGDYGEEQQQGYGAGSGYGYGGGGSDYGREDNYGGGGGGGGGGYGSHGSEGFYDGYHKEHHTPSYGHETSQYEDEGRPLHQVRPAAQTSQSQENQQVFKIYCEANPDYVITVKQDRVVLDFGDESNPHQQFIKDCKWGSRVQDEAGSPAFAIVNKASGLALAHGNEMVEKVTLKPYNPDVLDESVLWTQSDDVGNGYQCLRPVGNVHLNLDANHGDQTLRSGTELILFKWKKQENQKWKIFPINQTVSSHESYGQQHGHGRGREEYNDY